MIFIPAALLVILLALIFAPTVVCSREAEGAVVTSAKKAEKDEEPEPEPEEPEEDEDSESS